jgi:hypothetical protein
MCRRLEHPPISWQAADDQLAIQLEERFLPIRLKLLSNRQLIVKRE